MIAKSSKTARPILPPRTAIETAGWPFEQPQIRVACLNSKFDPRNGIENPRAEIEALRKIAFA